MPKPKSFKAKFLLSAYSLEQLPPDIGIEIAFIGRSNAGKSSALNAIAGIKKLARVSKTPGRTQAINIFTIDSQRRLIDLPGYGYAKVPKHLQQQWQHMVDRYLQQRSSLKALVLLMDIRHPLKDLDRHLLHWAAQCQLSVHVLLTKADKMSRAQALKQLAEVKKEISHYANVTLQTFSILTQEGVEEALMQINEWIISDFH